MQSPHFAVSEKHKQMLLKLLPVIAFVVPMVWLYSLDPPSFEAMWKGRTFQLFFIWLVALELILGWETLVGYKLGKLWSARTVGLVVAMVLPTIYVAVSYYGGLNAAIFNWATQSGITWANTMALSTEYLAFTAMFAAIVLLEFGFKGLKAFSVPVFFLALVGCIYTIDNIFPYGQFTPFQIFVPTTTALAAFFLNFMGYSTSIQNLHSDTQGTMPYLTATNPATGASTTFSIAWPCAGIESFLLFTVVMLLFLKRMHISLPAKIGYFAFGAAVTYIINAFRIVNIFIAGMNYGPYSTEVQNIHLYYGPMYAMIWIVVYPLLVLLSQMLWSRIRKRKGKPTRVQPFAPTPA
jgi:exosortase/archaeosortase family protein